MYKIYKLLLPNGKIYIGQTSLEVETRWNSGLGYINNKPLFHDILLYGWLNIKKEVLEKVATKEEAAERERYYILSYKSHEKEFGYNISTNYSSGIKKYKYTQCVETGKIYESQVMAGEEYGVSHSAISQAIKTGRQCKGKHWVTLLMTREERAKLP